MLQNVIAGDERAHILSVIGADGKSESVQDELLLYCFVIAVAAYLLTREPQKLTGDSVYALTHPPQAFRMSLLMNHVRSWCRQNRDALHDWLTAQLFQKLVNQTGMAMWGMHGVRVWAEQIAFLKKRDWNTSVASRGNFANLYCVAIGTRLTSEDGNSAKLAWRSMKNAPPPRTRGRARPTWPRVSASSP